MRRAVAAAAAACAALLLAAPALAHPRFVVANPDGRLAGGDPTTLQLSQAPSDPPVAKVTIFVPRGYSADLTGSPGKRIGDVYAQVKGPVGGVATMKGPITVGDPTRFERSSCADDRTRHEAVWLLAFGSVGGTTVVPLFLDRLSGKAAAAGAYELQLCLSTPVGARPGQRVTGLSPLQTTISLADVFRNPQRQGSYLWHADFTPYAIGKRVKAEETVSAGSVVSLPTKLSLSVHAERGFAIVKGTLEAAGRPIPRTTVAIYAGRTDKLDFADDPTLTIETDGHGRFTGALGILGKTYFRAGATVGLRDLPDDLCRSLLPTRDDCAHANLAPFFVASSGTVSAGR